MRCAAGMCSTSHGMLLLAVLVLCCLSALCSAEKERHCAVGCAHTRQARHSVFIQHHVQGNQAAGHSCAHSSEVCTPPLPPPLPRSCCRCAVLHSHWRWTLRGLPRLCGVLVLGENMELTFRLACCVCRRCEPASIAHPTTDYPRTGGQWCALTCHRSWKLPPEARCSPRCTSCSSPSCCARR